MFADVRTYWSPEAVKRVTGYDAGGHGEGTAVYSPDQFRRGRAGRLLAADGPRTDNAGDEAMVGRSPRTDAEECLKADDMVRRPTADYFRGGGYSRSV